MEDVTDRMAMGHPINLLAELLPRYWKVASQEHQQRHHAA
jgi:hypothetical protein